MNHEELLQNDSNVAWKAPSLKYLPAFVICLKIKENIYYYVLLVSGLSFHVDLSLVSQKDLKVHILSSSHVLG